MIRLLTADDWNILRHMRLEALEAEPAAFSGTAEDWVKRSEAELRQNLSEMAMFAAFDDKGEAAGIMGLVRQRAVKMAHRGTLLMVYLRQTLRGTGISTLLHERIKEHARAGGIRQIELAVSAENPKAMAFYKRLGYSQIGIIPGGFLHEGREIDEIMMAIRT
jgi:RimJ/RimL family protein N-acetyltransferase